MKRFLQIILVVVALMVMGAGVSGAESVTAAIGEEDTWTDGIVPQYMPAAAAGNGRQRIYVNNQDYGTLNLSISGTWAGTVTLQAAYDFGTTFQDTGETWTENTVQTVTCYEPGVTFRLGMDTGDYTSGTCNVRLSK